MIKMEARDLAQLLESKPPSPDHVAAKSLADTLNKNVELKEMVFGLQAKLATAEMQVKAAEQRGGFAEKYAEQKRIVKGIRDYFRNTAKALKKPNADTLIFGLALGDVT